jgi:hypothetical protein
MINFFFLYWLCWGLNSRLALVKQVLYHLSHALSSFFALSVFHIGSCVFCLRPALDHGSHSYTYHLAGMTGSYHHAWLIGWDVVLLTFSLDWLWAAIFLISASQVSGIISRSDHFLSLKLLYLGRIIHRYSLKRHCMPKWWQISFFLPTHSFHREVATIVCISCPFYKVISSHPIITDETAKSQLGF